MPHFSRAFSCLEYCRNRLLEDIRGQSGDTQRYQNTDEAPFYV